MSIAPAGSRVQPSAWLNRPHGSAVRMAQPSAWPSRPHGPAVRMAKSSHPPSGIGARFATAEALASPRSNPAGIPSNNVAAPLLPFPLSISPIRSHSSHNSHPLPSFFKKIAFFQKKIPGIFCRFKKRSYLCTRFRKKPESFDRNRSLTDWNRTGKTRQRGVFRDAAMNTSSVRQSFRPDKGRYESETPRPRQTKTVLARKGSRRYILTMKSLILAQDER